MRNEWFPANRAEYMTELRFQELGLTRGDIGERDAAFGTVEAAELEDAVELEVSTPAAAVTTTSVSLPPSLSPFLYCPYGADD